MERTEKVILTNLCMIRDGTRVLIPFDNGEYAANPVNETLNVRGIVFRETENGQITPVTVCFRETDLVLNY